jgi:hypothetical protein
MMPIKLGRAYLHIKSGKELVTQDLIKIKINNEWVGGVLYTESKGENYARTIPDFISCTKLITQK